jgi:ATP-dependent DNA ligase
MKPMKPMLFESAEIADLPELAADEQVALEQKCDGVRLLVTLTPQGMQVHGARGEPVRFAAAAQWFPALERQFGARDPGRDVADYEVIFDGELMIDTGLYIVFDLVSSRWGDQVVVRPRDEFIDRRRALEAMGVWLDDLASVRIIEQARTPRDKIALVDRVVRSGGEGFMAKRLDAPYLPGMRVSHSVKVKFLHTADVIVHSFIRTSTTGSAELRAWDGDRLVRVGGCSLIGKPEVKVGDVIEVAFAHYRGAMIQPRMLRVRDDKRPEDCTTDQFRPYSKAVV